MTYRDPSLSYFDIEFTVETAAELTESWRVAWMKEGHDFCRFELHAAAPAHVYAVGQLAERLLMRMWCLERDDEVEAVDVVVAVSQPHTIWLLPEVRPASWLDGAKQAFRLWALRRWWARWLAVRVRPRWSVRPAGSRSVTVRGQFPGVANVAVKRTVDPLAMEKYGMHPDRQTYLRVKSTVPRFS